MMCSLAVLCWPWPLGRTARCPVFELLFNLHRSKLVSYPHLLCGLTAEVEVMAADTTQSGGRIGSVLLVVAMKAEAEPIIQKLALQQNDNAMCDPLLVHTTCANLFHLTKSLKRLCWSTVLTQSSSGRTLCVSLSAHACRSCCDHPAPCKLHTAASEFCKAFNHSLSS